MEGRFRPTASSMYSRRTLATCWKDKEEIKYVCESVCV